MKRPGKNNQPIKSEVRSRKRTGCSRAKTGSTFALSPAASPGSRSNRSEYLLDDPAVMELLSLDRRRHAIER